MIQGLQRFQYTITIPIQLVKAMGWKAGIDIDFIVGGKDKLFMVKKND